MFPGDDTTLVGYRASAAVARYSRVLAAEMYGEHRPYGYVYGGSGGAYKTIGCIENTADVWDGAVPFVHGSPMSLPNLFTVQAHAIRVLRDKFPQIVDAVEPGGSGDMYAGLTIEERDALAEVTRMGFPPRAWFDVDRVAAGYTGVFCSLIDNVIGCDPEYFEDFWTVPGYLGANPPASLARARVQHKTTISQVVLQSEAAELGLPMSMSAMFGDSEHDMPAALRLAEPARGQPPGRDPHRSPAGTAPGHVLHIAQVIGDLVMTGFGESALRGADGDQGRRRGAASTTPIYLASQTYHRHQVPDTEEYPTCGTSSAPAASRSTRSAPSSSACGSRAGRRGSVQTRPLRREDDRGRGADGRGRLPWQADWYRSRVQEALGDRLDDHYRLWFVDHAMHTSPTVLPDDPRPVRTTRVVTYAGVLQQALRDLSAWVEKGRAAAEPDATRWSTARSSCPPTAAERKRHPAGGHGDGQRSVPGRGRGRRGSRVHRRRSRCRRARAPSSTAEWDFEGAGDFPDPTEGVDGSATRLRLATTLRLQRAGHVLPGAAGRQPAPGRRRLALRPRPEPRPGPGGRQPSEVGRRRRPAARGRRRAPSEWILISQASWRANHSSTSRRPCRATGASAAIW